MTPGTLKDILTEHGVVWDEQHWLTRPSHCSCGFCRAIRLVSSGYTVGLAVGRDLLPPSPVVQVQNTPVGS